MKKLLTLALTTALCLTSAVSLTACGHKCAYTDAWSSDATYHWHACTDNDCDSVSEKTVHNWKAGEVITPATHIEKGLRHFNCAVCGATKTDTYLLSTTVPSNLWGEAFLLGDNYTITETAEYLSLGTISSVASRSGNRIFRESITRRLNGEVLEQSRQYFSVETGLCFVFSPLWQDAAVAGYYKHALTTETPKSLYEKQELTFFPLIARNFTEYSYYPQTYSYTADRIEADGVVWTSVSLAFLEGKVKSLSYTTTDGSATVRHTVTVTYGETDVTLPTNLLH